MSENPLCLIIKDCIIEWPKVLFNAKTSKFVMWFHHEPAVWTRSWFSA